MEHELSESRREAAQTEREGLEQVEQLEQQGEKLDEHIEQAKRKSDPEIVPAGLGAAAKTSEEDEEGGMGNAGDRTPTR